MDASSSSKNQSYDYNNENSSTSRSNSNGDVQITIEKPVVKELKIVVIGDGYIGKTCMLWSFVYNKFPRDYVPTVFETHAR